MKKFCLVIVSMSVLVSSCALLGGGSHPVEPERPSALFNGKNLDGWYVWIKDRGKNKDPNGVFTVKDGVIRVSGKESGCITTEKEYKNYHLIVEYRFTGEVFGERAEKKAVPDSGILFHSRGADGAFYGTWMPSLEYNVIEGASGDFWTVGTKDTPEVTLTAKVGAKKNAWDHWQWDARSTNLVTLSGCKRVCRRGNVKEEKNGWNTAELICDGEKATCVFNGKVVNEAERVTPSAGRIQLQSEWSGIEFRKVEIRPIKRPVSYYTAKANAITKKYTDRAGDPHFGAVEACEYLESVAQDADRLMFSKYDLAQIWQAYTIKAWVLFRDDLFLKGFDAMLAAEPAIARQEMTAARLVPHYRALQDAKTFPKAEKDINFGQTLASMGIADNNVVHLKDYWNATNVTAVFQKLVDDPSVTTIVLDKMPSPWYIDSVKFHSKVNGKRVLMKSGCQVLRCPDRLQHVIKGKSAAMFSVNGGKNVIIESDAAKPEDVHVGFYRSYAERAKFNKREGASGLGVGGADSRTDCSSNIVFRNFRVADCEQDGLAVGGLWRPPEEIYVENVLLDSNFRQGTSPCGYYSLYFKNCKFINTRGGPPTAGVDVEPYDDFLCTANLYFFDCEFANNGGGGLVFATSTRDPILCYVKRCRFKPTPGSQIEICARPSRYIAADGKPYSNILVDDSEFYSRGATIRFIPSPIYNVTLRNCVIRDARTPGEKSRAKKGPSPISLSLNRDFGQPDMTDNIRPKVTFENVRIEGFETSDPLGISDEIGKLNIKGVFFGEVNWNGREVDLSRCEYLAPDIAEKRNEFADLKTLVKPKHVPASDAAMPESNAELCFTGAWWLKAPNHSYYFWADKGRAVSFDFDLRYPGYWKNPPTNSLTIVSTSGQEVPIGEVTRGVKRLTYTAPETGWHRFTPGLVLDKNTIGGINWYVSNVRGARFAWQADTQSDCFAKFFLKDRSKDYTGYFEVPAGGKECRLRVSFGGFELYDPAGNLVEKVNANDYRGRHILKIRPSTDKAEIWSFKTPCTADGGYTRALRFYLPLNGLWADTPEDLPCVYAEHHVPAKIADKAGAVAAASGTVRLDKRGLSADCLKILEAAKAERKAFAEKKEWAGHKRAVEAQIERMRAGGMNDDTQRQIDDLSKAVALNGRLAEMEDKAAAETPDVFETAAFCQAFLPTVALDAARVKDFIVWKASGKDLAADYPALHKEISSVYFEDKVGDQIEGLGLNNPRGVLEYGAPAKLAALAEMIRAQIGAK